MFVAVAQMVSDHDIGIANKAILITSHLPLDAYPRVLEEMKVALEYNTSSKCNAFEVFLNILCVPILDNMPSHLYGPNNRNLLLRV